MITSRLARAIKKMFIWGLTCHGTFPLILLKMRVKVQATMEMFCQCGSCASSSCFWKFKSLHLYKPKKNKKTVEKQITYLCWWYKLKSRSDSACKTRITGVNIQVYVYSGTLSVILWASHGFIHQPNIALCECKCVAMMQIDVITCKRLPSPKCRTSRIVSDWMNAARIT